MSNIKWHPTSPLLMLFSHSVLSDFLWSHGLQYTWLPCSSLSSRDCSNSCQLNGWCHPTSHPLSLPSPSASYLSQHQGLFQWLTLQFRWPMHWSISISPYNEYSGWISFKIYCFDLLAIQGTQESSLARQFESISSLALSLLYGPTLTSIHDYWKNHSFDYIELCWQSMSLLF